MAQRLFRNRQASQLTPWRPGARQESSEVVFVLAAEVLGVCAVEKETEEAAAEAEAEAEAEGELAREVAGELIRGRL
jgi:aminoglycoside phosphotransferase